MDDYKRMTEEEMAKKDPLMRHTHPTEILKGLIEVLRKIGAKEFLEGAGHNQEQDAFFGCMFALAMRSYQGREFYMQQVSDPPDFELIAPTDRPTRERPFDHLNVEVVTLPVEIDQASDKLQFALEILERTKFTKKYEQGTVLLIMVKGACGPELLNLLRTWVAANPERIKNFGEIMMMCIVSVSEEKSFTYAVGSVSKTWQGEFCLLDEFYKPLIDHPMIHKYGVHVEKPDNPSESPLKAFDI